MKTSLASVLVLFLVSGVHLSLESTVDWSYSEPNGPDSWPATCKTGKKQSPINVVSDETIKTDLGSLKFAHYDYAYPATLTNTGHTVQIDLNGVPMYLSGGGLSSTYIFKQMHLHWDSEHSIDGNRDALELHMVHYSKDYPDFETAAKNDYGLVVIAVLFRISDEDNENLASIVDAASRFNFDWIGKTETPIQNRIIPSLLMPKDYTTFYRYDGSLTTPDCLESVTWFILTEKLTISDSQVRLFENVRTKNGTLKSNYRPIQKLGSRDVYHRLAGYSKASMTSQSTIFVAIIISTLQLVS